MKRTMIVMFALAMLLAWSGSAMAQLADVGPMAGNTKLGAVAQLNCKTGNAFWFGTQALAEQSQLAVFPYFSGSQDGWWSGMALINAAAAAEANNIVAGSLCIVGVNEDGQGFAKVYGQTLYSQNMKALLVDDIDSDESRWGKRTVVAVFRNQNTGTTAGLKGFGMMGDGVQAQGYFTQNGTSLPGDVVFNYTPGAPFWRGVALFNNHATQPVYVGARVVHENGVTDELSAVNRIIINPGSMKAVTFEELTDKLAVDANQRARFVFNGFDAPAGAGVRNSLMGFAFFGDGEQAMGYLPTDN